MNRIFHYLQKPLLPLGLLYGFLMRLRAWLYSLNILQGKKIPVPVISVGNLSMGGSGKTPIVIYLAQLLIKNGYRPAVISRGYRGKANKSINVVADGRGILLDCRQSGDEPQLIAQTIPGLVVITGKQRSSPCLYAVEKFQCNVIILDDAFQHLGTKRDIDMVLFNATTPLRYLHVIPSGILREPFFALNRANIIVLTGYCDKCHAETSALLMHLSRHIKNKPVFYSRNISSHLYRDDGEIFQPYQLVGPVLAFCGIAAPHRFQATLNEMQIECADFISFRDHQDYTVAMLEKLEKRAEDLGCRMLVTTMKDMVKIKGMITRLPLYAVSLEVFFDHTFAETVLQRLSQRR